MTPDRGSADPSPYGSAYPRTCKVLLDMDLEMDQGHVPRRRDRGPVSTYANRLARMHYLMHHFPGGHPVLDIEKQLVQMAGSELREFVLRTSAVNSPARAGMKAQIRSIVQSRIESLIHDREARKRILDSVTESGLEEVLTGTS